MKNLLLTVRFKLRLRKMTSCVLVLVVAIFIVSCGNNSENGQIGVTGDQATMAFTAPARLLQARLVVRENLLLQVTIEGRVVTVQPNANGQYVFRTTVTPNTSSIVSLAWFELVGDVMLRLATASKTLNVGSESSPATLRFSETEFNTEIDDDNDGFSNLRERREGTGFNNPDDPDEEPVAVTLNFRFFLPAQLSDATEEIRSQVSAQAFVNEQVVPLTREGNGWRGTVQVTKNSDPLITANFFATSEQVLQIATFSRSQNVGQGANIDFLDDVYEVDSFNNDGDAFSNAREIAEGSDPEDPSDPDSDGDGFADEVDNCPAIPNIDQADADSDSVGDACDSFNNLVDPDEDGISNSDFPPDNCPSDPNPNQSDVDSDGIGDVCDNSNGLDPDDDQVNNPIDNCPVDANNNQSDVDSDGIGDVCDPFNNLIDPDQDGVNNDATPPDNCPDSPNPNQLDTDGDGVGDVCELPNVTPVSNAGPDQVIQEGSTLQLDGTGSSDSDGSLASFQWFEGSVSLASGVTAAIPGLSEGEHLIDLVVTDADGATDTDQLQVTVTAAPVANVDPTANAGPNQTIQEGTSLQVDGGSSVDNDGLLVSYAWSEGGVSLATGENASITGLSVGVHLIDLLVTDDDGATDTDQLQVTVTAAPVPNVAPTSDAGVDQTIQEGTSLQVDGGSSVDNDGLLVSYAWSEGGVSLATGENASITGLSVGVHLIDLLVTDDDGATDTDQLQVTVTAAPVPNVAPTSDAGVDQTIQEGTSLQVDGGSSVDNDGLLVSYAWSEGGVSLATGENASITGLLEGIHLIDLLVTDDDGATDTDQLQVTVTAAPVANVAPTAVGAVDSASVEEGVSVQLDGSGSSDADGTVLSFAWLNITTSSALGTTETVSAVLPLGLNEIQLTVTDDDGATDTDQLQVTVTAAPVANVAPTAVGAVDSASVEEGVSVQLDGSGSSDADGTVLSFAWLNITTSSALGTTETVSAVLPLGLNEIQLTVTDADGATDTDQLQVTVTAAPVANVAPTAVGAVDSASVEEGVSVQLDGSGSSDADGTVLSFAWLNVTTSTALGTTETVSAVLPLGINEIQLTVTDAAGATDTDQLQVSVTAAPVPNVVPIALATVDLISVEEGVSVQLDGSGSSDADGTVLSFAWLNVTTSTALGTTGTVSAVLPLGINEIQLTVTDADGAIDTDQLQVSVTAAPVPNVVPIALATVDLISVEEGVSVQLDGSGSSDPDGTVLSFAWLNITTSTALGTADVVSAVLPLGVNQIQLTVTDADGAMDTDDLEVEVTAVTG